MKPRDLAPGKYQWIERGIWARGTASGPVFGISYMYRGQRVREAHARDHRVG